MELLIRNTDTSWHLFYETVMFNSAYQRKQITINNFKKSVSFKCNKLKNVMEQKELNRM